MSRWPLYSRFSQDRKYRGIVKQFDNFQSGPKQGLMETIRPGIFQPSQQVSIKAINLVSPNAKATVNPAPGNPFPLGPLYNNSTDTDPLDPTKWAPTGDALWIQFASSILNTPIAPFPSQYIGPLLHLQDCHLTQHNTSGGTISLKSALWVELLSSIWDPTTLCWNTMPATMNEATKDAAGTLRYYSPDVSIDDFTTILNGYDGQLAAGATYNDGASDSSLLPGAEEPYIASMFPQNFPFGNANINDTVLDRKKCVGQPTTTTVQAAGYPFDWNTSGGHAPPDQHQVLWNSPYNVNSNPGFIGGKILILPYNPTVRVPTSSTITGFDSSTGEFTVSPAFDYAPEVDQTGNLALTDSICVFFPITGMALRLFAYGPQSSFSSFTDAFSKLELITQVFKEALTSP